MNRMGSVSVQRGPVGELHHAAKLIFVDAGQIQLLTPTLGVNSDLPRIAGYELGGVMKFTDRSALDAYGAHPVHQKLLQWLMPLIDPLEVDFEA